MFSKLGPHQAAKGVPSFQCYPWEAGEKPSGGETQRGPALSKPLALFRAFLWSWTVPQRSVFQSTPPDTEIWLPQTFWEPRGAECGQSWPT